MRIKLNSVMVDNQDKALKFYTQVLGFVTKHDIPVGEFRWITVVSPEGPDDLELALEPNANPAAKTFQEALFKQGIPLAAFGVADIDAEFKRLKELNVVFTSIAEHSDPDRSGRGLCRCDCSKLHMRPAHDCGGSCGAT